MTDLAIANNQALEPPHTPDSADLPDPADESPEVPAAPLYEYGTTTEVPAGYVSDAELLAWLQGKSSGQYGELDQLMDASNARSKLVKDLSHVKEMLANADPAVALAEIQTLRAAYAGTEHASDIDELLSPIERDLETYANQMAAIDQIPTDGDGIDAELMEQNKADLKAKVSAAFGSLSGPIDATIKDLEHDDQLALVQIQALMSEIRETAQLTSNIIANRSQTSDSIVGNIRA